MFNIFKEIKTEDKVFTYKYLVEGEWQQSRNRRKIEVFSPIDGSFLGRLQSVLPKEADIAVTDASFAQGAWAATPFSKKVLIFKRIIELIQKNKDLLADLLTQEIGKPKQDSKNEITRAIEIIKETVALVFQKESKVKIGKKTCLIQRVPVGVVLCITPFNYPIYTTATKIVPALISGNSVILKPSVLGTISVLHFAQLFNKAGIPAGVLNVVTGKGDEIGRYLASHALINMISFTGSSKVGKEMAKRAGMVNLVLELGGERPSNCSFRC
jgi:glyceraldehyde-3-phosphate dehydrogenase (NADP+)